MRLIQSREIGALIRSGTGVPPVRITTHGRDARATIGLNGRNTARRGRNQIPCAKFNAEGAKVFAKAAKPLASAFLCSQPIRLPVQPVKVRSAQTMQE